jgi:hypothetical protein
LFRSDRRIPFWRVALYTVGILALALMLEPNTVPEQPTFPRDGHAIASLNLAVSSAMCGSTGLFSQTYQPAKFLSDNQWATAVPLGQVVTTIAGSVGSYCSTADYPLLNEDNSLSLLETLAINLRPNVSAKAIARVLLFAKLAVLAAVCAALLNLGASVALAGACTIAAVAVLRALIDERMAYSIHSFFFVLVLLNALVYGVALRVAGGSSRWFVAVAIAAGFITAFSVNMRASYLPVYLSFGLAYMAAVYRKVGRRTAVAGFAAVAAGYFLFQYPFIIRRIPETDYNHTFHTVSHPLVLSLALPPNDLAQREGIKWLDEDGIVLARRVDPKAQYLGPGYDRALLTYYKNLWRNYPREMLRIYNEKLKTAGADMIQHRYRFVDGWIRRPLMPLRWVDDGRYLLAIFVVSAAIAFWSYFRYGVRFGFWAGLLFVAGTLLYLESALILPYYYLVYHNALLMVTVFWTFFAVQVAVNVTASVGRRAWLLSTR